MHHIDYHLLIIDYYQIINYKLVILVEKKEDKNKL